MRTAPISWRAASRSWCGRRFRVDSARSAGLVEGVIASVRPTWKERYPLIAIEEYMEWRRDDGTHFDPWLRIHELVGGEILAGRATLDGRSWFVGMHRV